MAAAARPSSRAAQAGAADHRQPGGEAVRRFLEMRQFRGAFCPRPKFCYFVRTAQAAFEVGSRVLCDAPWADGQKCAPFAYAAV